ncbi:hypothetical protein T492DRAFT_867186 [Pavlovales sp. CCMP2436]|nr:hypothetical protein T492DRAFT_867186 [Pavlovales sp. CCMP2436]
MDADELPAEPAAGPPLMDDSEAAVETDSSWSGGGKSGSSFWAQQRQRSASLTRTDSLAAVRMETERELQAHYAGTDPGSGGDDEDDASNLSDEDNTSYEYIRWRVACYFESDVVEAVMLLATFYVLFATDIRLAVTEVAADVGFESLYILAFSLFGAELVLCSWAKEGYWLSFFWWLDLVATLSLVLDISFFWDPIGAAITSVADNGPSATDNGAAVASHVSQSARAGSRAGRVVRMVKLLRLFRFAKVQRWLRYFLAAVRYRCSNGAERAELGLSRTLSVSSLGEGRRRAAAASQAAEVCK